MANVCFCYCKACCEARIVVKSIYKILNKFRWLLDAYIVDFFCEDLWSKLPLTWQKSLKQLTPNELGNWLSGEKNSTRTVLPLSLLALRQVTESLQINRDHNDRLAFNCCTNDLSNRIYEKTETESDLKLQNFELEEKQCRLLLKHVKIKKRYEIKKLAHTTSKLAKITDCRCVVDVGSGMGHLSRVLAVDYDLQVICVEQDEILLQQARKWDEELKVTVQKQQKNFSFKTPQHLAVKIDASNVQTELIEKMDENVDTQNGFGIVGLHPCGDLAVNLMRLYSSCNEARFLCIVGCCYMKLSVSETCQENNGYPLSSFVSKISDNKLSYNALEVACHAKEKHFDKIKSGQYDDLKIHTFRAALEYLLVEEDANNRHGHLKSVKLRDGTSFEQYCSMALKNTAFENSTVLSKTNNQQSYEMLERWKDVLYFGCLRLMLAPLVETAVLLDRYLYLSELNLKPSLKAEFDCRISPRNFVLTSQKS